MFGYIKIAKPELKVREYELYKAVYCSLCRRLGKNYGILSRLTLSYDFTFLALLQMSLSDGCDGFVQKRCTFNPLKKCNYCKNDDICDLPAAAAMIMLYYKIKDNIDDEKGIKRLGYLCLKPIFSGARKKAARLYPEIESIIEEYIAEQSVIESEGCFNIDKAADPSGKMLSRLLQLLSDDTTQKRILERLGYCIGRYIYLLDAACDLEDDNKKLRYNPIVVPFEVDNKQHIKEHIEPQLYFCINEAARAFELLDIKKHKSILGNIIYLGLEETFRQSLQT
ncbi:MAG: hypothetical protein E7561_00110 [Ruminococcaceae bacterium]|nr:hypothetical protein [Oscillospiraceae bacterium]